MKFFSTFFTGLLFLLPALSSAQSGDLFLHHYKIPLKNVENQNYAVTQGNRGVMYFANQKGILSYDGVNWELIATANTPYTLATDKARQNTVFVGCRESFGYLKTDNRGVDIFVSISKEYSDFGEIRQSFLTPDYGYFYSSKALFKVSLADKKVLKVWKPTQEGDWQGIVQLNQHIYIQIKNKGLHQVQDNQLVACPETQPYSGLSVQTAFAFSANQCLVGMSNNWAYLFDGKKLQLYMPVAREYMLGSAIHTSLSLSDKLGAIGTLSGGVILLNKQNYTTQHIINYQTGLPDDEVYALGADSQGGLWICHAKGITRADMDLPVRLYSGYAGLEGNIESMLNMNDSLFVATSDGLFYLQKVAQYEQVESLIKKERRYLKTVETVTKTQKITDEPQAGKVRIYRHSRDGIKQPKRKIELVEDTKSKDIPTRTVSSELTTSFFSNAEARKAYAVQSIPFVFKKVQDLDTKCKQLLHYQNRLLVATNQGVYEVYHEGKELISRKIIPNEYINFMIQSPQKANHFYIGTDKGVFWIAFERGGWIVKDQQTNLNRAIHSILEYQNQLWLGAESQVFKLTIGKDKLGKPQVYSFKDSYSENVTVRVLKDKPAFLLTSGVYTYTEAQDKMFKDARLARYFNAQSPLFYGQPNYTWIRNGNWQNISHPTDTDSLKTIFLELFDEIQDIYVDAHRNIWVVDNNSLYSIDASAQFHDGGHFDIFLKHIVQNLPNSEEEAFLDLALSHFEYSKQGLAVTFKMASPFYRHEHSIEYQYKLEGLSDEWSKWDTKSIIAYPYIPSGKYVLRIRAKNMFGKVSEEKVYAFEVRPPFWETYWFYGLQISVLAGLLLIAFVFNRRGQNSRWAIVLTIIALITLFEFLTLLFEPYVDTFANGIPFFKLGMNILLALTLLPAEHYLRRWLQRPAKRITLADDNTSIPERHERQDTPHVAEQESPAASKTLES